MLKSQTDLRHTRGDRLCLILSQSYCHPAVSGWVRFYIHPQLSGCVKEVFPDCREVDQNSLPVLKSNPNPYLSQTFGFKPCDGGIRAALTGCLTWCYSLTFTPELTFTSVLTSHQIHRWDHVTVWIYYLWQLDNPPNITLNVNRMNRNSPPSTHTAHCDWQEVWGWAGQEVDPAGTGSVLCRSDMPGRPNRKQDITEMTAPLDLWPPWRLTSKREGHTLTHMQLRIKATVWV